MSENIIPSTRYRKAVYYNPDRVSKPLYLMYDVYDSKCYVEIEETLMEYPYGLSFVGTLGFGWEED